MADEDTRAIAAKRVHVVLIPGFAGFDALGQLEYYGGVTSVFQNLPPNNAVLHYFDNFPTAAVITRAARLRRYLAKRIARGDISDGDEVVLVGHSTGGLDIRWLFWDLHHLKDRIVVDGGVEVRSVDVLRRVHRVVFISVPHWGTNIADWLRSEWLLREAVVADLRAAVTGSQVFLLDWVESMLAGGAARITGAGLFRAIQDALTEANEYNGKPSAMRKAEAHEAASQLALYLGHMAWDFRAIDDLTSFPGQTDKPVSPAHFSVTQRREEQRLLHNVKFCSYVTLGRQPFCFDETCVPTRWDLTKPWTYPECTKKSVMNNRTDVVYRMCYRAGAGGPFKKPPLPADVTIRWKGAPDHPIEVWDNDGIVNTLSMLWPQGDNVLVPADHMDIVGHYGATAAERGGGRRYCTYDLLRSGSGFGKRMFDDVWGEIFAFCLGWEKAQTATAA